MTDDTESNSPKKKWRVGWRMYDAAKSKPIYAPMTYDTFADADYCRREMQKMYTGYHFFVDTVGKEQGK